MSAALRSAGVKLRSSRSGDHKTTCPKCSHTRKNKTDPCLSVTIDDMGAVVKCHHCGWTEAFNDRPMEDRPRREPRRPDYKPKEEALPAPVLAWFRERGIGSETVRKNAIGYVRVWMPHAEAEVSAIAFPYLRDGEVVNVKYRTADKHFRQEKDAEKVFFGMDHGQGQSLVIVEGEMDKLALNEAGVWSVVSVPDGAPKDVKNEPFDPADDAKFEYVWNCQAFLDRFPRIILAVDNDAPGRALEEELARRIGKERCWRVTWPEGCKDANDVLLALGGKVLRECIDGARAFPIQSLYEASDFEAATLQLYREGRQRGLSTGFDNIDVFMTIRPGELSIVTGYPSSGKSEFVDALAVNMAQKHGWKFAVCSFENPPDEHIAKWAEKYLGQPFYDGPTPRMSERDLAIAGRWISGHFYLIRADEEAPTIDWVLSKAKAAVSRYGINGLVLDPYNEFEHSRPNGMTETEYVSQMLGKIKRFAQAHGVHVWFVAHPAKPLKDKQNEPPSLYDISGSAHWVNKADLGVSVHRGWLENGERDTETEIHVKKVRFRSVGKPGMARLAYLPAIGRYRETT